MLKCDLLLCYKISHCKVVIHDLDFLVFSDCSVTRGHQSIKFVISVAHCRLDFTINSSIAYKFKSTSAMKLESA